MTDPKGVMSVEEALGWLGKWYDAWYYNESHGDQTKEPNKTALKALTVLREATKPRVVSREWVENLANGVMTLFLSDGTAQSHIIDKLRELGISVEGER